MSHPPRIGVWAAVSTLAQAAEDKISLESQEQQGREFAEAVGGEVVAVYTVPGHSRDLWRWSDAESQMVAYANLRRDVEASRIDVLWALDVDRLGRDPALAQQVISLVERSGAEVYLQSAPHQLGQKTTAHRYVSAIQSVRVGEDQALRKHRHHSGMKGRILKRGLLAGLPPFYLDVERDPVSGEVVGYRFSDQVGALDLMTRLFLEGHSYAEICRRLDASGYPPPGDGRHWWARLANEVMLSDVPAGYAHWGPYRTPEPSPHVPARWDSETFAAVVRERQRRSVSGFTRRGAGPLTRVAYCARCGGHMVRARPRRTSPYYLRCNRHAQKAVYPEYTCHANSIREDAVLEAVGDFLQEMSTPEAIDAMLAEQQEGHQGQALHSELDAARRAVTDLEVRRRRAAHAYAAGDMDLTIYREVDSELSERLAAEQARAQDLEQVIAAMPDLEQQREAILGLVQVLPDLLTSEEPATIAAMLQEAGLHIYIEAGLVREIVLE